MKQTLFGIIFLLACTVQGFCQNLLVNDSNGDLVSFDINGCVTNVIQNIGFYTDIASNPDGFFYGINSLGKLSRIDVDNGLVDQVHDFPGTAFYALTSDATGLVYAASGLGDLVSYNPANGQVTTYPLMGFGAAGDLTYYQGGLYMATNNNSLVFIDPWNPDNNEVFLDFTTSGASIYGIVSTVDGCNVATYAFSNEANARVYQIDWINKTFTYVCQIDKEVYGGSSEFEFIASDDLIMIEDIIIESAACDEGTSKITIIAESETGSLSYSIDGINFQEGNEFDNLSFGDYVVYIKDEAGCVGSEDISIDVGFLAIDEVQTTPSVCGQESGKALVFVNASTQQLSYSLDNISFQENPFFEGLAPGDYLVYVKSDQNCLEEFPFNIEQSKAISSEATIYNSSCTEGKSFLIINAQSPNGGLSYSIDGVNYVADSLIQDLNENEYEVFVKDASDCADTLFTTTETATIDLQVISNKPSTCRENNGEIQVNVNSNFDSYAFYFNGESSTSNVFSELAPGPYTFEILSPDGCVHIFEQQVDEIEMYTLDTVKIDPDYCGLHSGAIHAQVFNNGNLVSYGLNNQANDFGEFINLSSGLYQLLITDQNNCLTILDLDIPALDCPIFFPNIMNSGFSEDGIFKPKSSLELSVEYFVVMDRWGNKVYHAQNFLLNDPHVFWDGTLNGRALNSGVYVFALKLKGNDNLYSGDVTLVR